MLQNKEESCFEAKLLTYLIRITIAVLERTHTYKLDLASFILHCKQTEFSVNFSHSLLIT